MNIKILHIFDHSLPLHSGYSFRSMNILKQQRAMGYHTIQITSAKQGGQTLEDDVDGIHFYRTLPNNSIYNKLPLLNQWHIVRGLARRLDTIIPNEKPDILHAHSPCLNGLAALKVRKKFDTPVVYELRAFWEDAAVNHGYCKENDLRYQLSRSLESYVLKRVNAVTTICNGLKKDIIARGLAAESVTVIPNAVDLDKFRQDGERDQSLSESLGIAGHIVLGFIGSFYDYEGLDLLISAMQLIIKKQPKLKLLLVGGGFQKKNLQWKVKHLGLNSIVKFVDRVPHNEIQRYYNLVDIFIYPRLSMRLTELVTPLKPLEAMAQGRLVMASNVGGHREIIRHCKTGQLFNPGDVHDLSQKVLQLLNEQGGWAAHQKAARSYIEESRTWPGSVARYQEVYEQLLRRCK